MGEVIKNLGWYLIIFVITLSVVSGVIGKNKALNQLLDECKDKDATHIDLILDLQQENAKLNDYIIGIEEDKFKYKNDEVYNMLQDFTSEICEEIQSR